MSNSTYAVSHERKELYDCGQGLRLYSDTFNAQLGRYDPLQFESEEALFDYLRNEGVTDSARRIARELFAFKYDALMGESAIFDESYEHYLLVGSVYEEDTVGKTLKEIYG